jgi:hypothetical protein
MESSTDVLPWPFLPAMTTVLPSGVISTATSRLTFSAVSLTIFTAGHRRTFEPGEGAVERDGHLRGRLRLGLGVVAGGNGHDACFLR